MKNLYRQSYATRYPPDGYASGRGRPLRRGPSPSFRDNPKQLHNALDIALIAILFCCFGSVVFFTMKVQELKEAPSWSVALYLVPIALTTLAIVARPMSALRTLLISSPLFVFVLWALASMAWSNQPELTLKQGLLLCFTFASAGMMAQFLSWVRIARILAGLFTLQALLSAGLAVFKPEWGVMTTIYPGAWAGLWAFKQTFGVSMALGAASVFSYLLLQPKSAIWTVPSLLLIFICLVKSEATTAIVISMAAVAMPALVWFAQRNAVAAVFSSWLAATGIAAVFLVITVLAPIIFEALGKAPTLTGRTDIWHALESAIDSRKLLGWGYQAFWTDTSLTSPVDVIERAMDGFRPPDAHSTPTDIQLQLGTIGLILASVIFFRAWIQAVMLAAQEPGMILCLAILATVSGMGFTETIGLYPMEGMTLIIHVMIIKVALSAWRRKSMDDGAMILP